MINVWVLEDNADFAKEFAEYLSGYQIDVVPFARVDEFHAAFTNQPLPDLLVIDQFIETSDMIPQIPAIRAKFAGGIVVLTGNNQVFDRVTALEVGCDDFVLKTVDPREILARIRAVARRSHPVPELEEAASVAKGAWQIDPRVLDVVGPDGHRLNLTTMQFRAIQYLDEHRGEVVNRKDLYAQLLGRDANPNSRTIDVMISVLRKKLSGMNNSNCQIRSMRGSGYIFSGIAG